MEADRALRVRQKLDGARLRALRSARGISVEECAEALQLTTDAVSAKEAGAEPLLAAEFWRFCYACGVSVADVYSEASAVFASVDAREQRLQRKLLGASLADARESAGLSLIDSARLAGTSDERLRLGELGQVELTLAETEALAEGYGIEPHSLFPAKSGAQPGRPSRGAASSPASAFASDVTEFLRRPDAERCVRAAMALAQLDDLALGALEDALLFLRGA
ncbi:MAG: helix-turn-helix domain-containing protein [Anaerolineae bacterium]